MADKKSYFHQLTPTHEQRILEMYDYCQQKVNAVDTDNVKFFERNGMLSMSCIHWFELTVSYIMPILLEKNYMGQNTFYTRCLQFRLEHPVDFLYLKYQVMTTKEILKIK